MHLYLQGGLFPSILAKLYLHLMESTNYIASHEVIFSIPLLDPNILIMFSEEYDLLLCNATSGKNHLMFQRNVLFPSSVLKSKLLVSCWFLAWLTLQPWHWRQYISLNSQTFTEAQDIRTRTITFFAGITVKTSNPTSVIYTLPFRWEATLVLHYISIYITRNYDPDYQLLENHRLLNFT
jgi:hypothetical protein